MVEMVNEGIEDKLGEIDISKGAEDSIYVVAWASKIWFRFRRLESGVSDYSMGEMQILSSTCDFVELDCGIELDAEELDACVRLGKKLSREANKSDSDRKLSPEVIDGE